MRWRSTARSAASRRRPIGRWFARRSPQTKAWQACCQPLAERSRLIAVMDSLLRDLRHAVRNLLRTPGFAVITVFTLALGIGANTAIFSVVNGVILRPLGYPRPERLVYISSQ